MKLRALLIALLFAFILIPNNSAKAQFYNDAISIDPFSLLWGISGTFETKVDDKNSFTISAMYASWGWYSWSETYFGVGASYRWYIFNWFWDKKRKHGPIEGFSFGPAVALGYYKGFDNYHWDGNTWVSDSRGSLSVSIGAEAAYKWVFAENWFLEPIVKLMITIPSYSRNFGDFGGVNIGYTW